MSLIKKLSSYDRKQDILKDHFESGLSMGNQLFELAELLGQQISYDEVLSLVARKIRVIFNVDVASVVMINPLTGQTLKTVFQTGRAIAGKAYVLLQSNLIGWVSKRKQPFLSDNLKIDSRFRKDALANTDIQSAMCVPLFAEGSEIGYLLVLNKMDSQVFSENDFSWFNKLSAVTAPFLCNTSKIQRYFSIPLSDNLLLEKYAKLGLIGRCSRFVELLKAVEAAAKSDVRILLEGRSGTGKELVARAIHKMSSRQNQPFIAIDCGAIPENLIESEFFGHVKGAFTGATSDRKGLFEEANQGTIFIDEISNLPLNMQMKLLRVLQENEIRVLGSNKMRRVNVRIVAASSPPLQELVEQGQFREDLFYRLFVYPIDIPTLNERAEDIPILANYFLKKFAGQQQKPLQMIHPALLNYLQERNWAGNVRELENLVERVVTLAPGDSNVLTLDILPIEYRKEYPNNSTPAVETHSRKALPECVAEFERKVIRGMLKECGWNQSKAARMLGISERTIRYKMEKLGIFKLD